MRGILDGGMQPGIWYYATFWAADYAIHGMNTSDHSRCHKSIHKDTDCIWGHIDTARRRYNAVNILQNLHKRHPTR